MRKFLALLFLSALCSAQNTVQVTASNIASGTIPLASGTILFQAVDQNGNAISYQLGGGGQQILYPTACSVTNGAIAANCYVANTAATNPQNVCFLVTVKDALNNVVLGGTLASGYGCVQPAASNSWCANAVCDFDMYVPNLAGIPIAKLPLPTPTSLGGVYALSCAAGQVQNGITIAGTPSCVSTGGGSANVGFQAAPPVQTVVSIAPDLTGTCDYPSAYYLPGTWQLCSPGNNQLFLNFGTGNFQVFTIRAPYQAIPNGAVPAWVQQNGDFELKTSSATPCTTTNGSVQYDNSGAFGCTDLTFQTSNSSSPNYSSSYDWNINLQTSGPTLPALALTEINNSTSGAGGTTSGISVTTEGDGQSGGPSSESVVGVLSTTLPSKSATSNNNQYSFEGTMSDYSGRSTTIGERDAFLTAAGNLTGTVTIDAGFHVRTPTIGSGGNPTHRYGLLVDDQTQVGSGSNPDPHGITVKGGGIQQTPVQYNALPLCGSNTSGESIPITDSNTGTYNANITAGGGTNSVIAYCNGTNWTAH